MSPSSTQPRSGFLHQSGAVVGSINLFFDAALRKPTSIYHPLNFSTKPEQHSFCTAQIIASFGVKLAYDVKIAGNHCKQKARNFSVYQEVSGFALLKLEITAQSASSWGCCKIRLCFRPTESNSIHEIGRFRWEQSNKLQHCPRKLYTVLVKTPFSGVLTVTRTAFGAGGRT